MWCNQPQAKCWPLISLSCLLPPPLGSQPVWTLPTWPHRCAIQVSISPHTCQTQCWGREGSQGGEGAGWTPFPLWTPPPLPTINLIVFSTSLHFQEFVGLKYSLRCYLPSLGIHYFIITRLILILLNRIHWIVTIHQAHQINPVQAGWIWGYCQVGRMRGRGESPGKPTGSRDEKTTPVNTLNRCKNH